MARPALTLSVRRRTGLYPACALAWALTGALAHAQVQPASAARAGERLSDWLLRQSDDGSAYATGLHWQAHRPSPKKSQVYVAQENFACYL